MDRTARCRWVAGYRFDSESHTGKTIRLDGWKDREDPEAGPTPAELVPISLGACTGMDVVHIMGKMKVEFEALEVEVNSTLPDTYPKHFETMTVLYHFTGSDLDPAKLEKAIALSRDTYCVVSQSLIPKAEITHLYTINGGEPVEVAEAAK